MKENLLRKAGKIHIVGVNGSGTSGLAGILRAQGKKITGSDLQTTGHSAQNIRADHEVVIYSLAIDEANPEMQEARRRKIPLLSYPEAVGELTKDYETIAICGTHGKSTITALIAKILTENDFDPTVLVGTRLRELGDTNFRLGKSRLLVLEACEYKRAFLNYHPQIILLNTLDPDHFDYYKNFEEYLSAFRSFVDRLPRDGYFFSNRDDADVEEIGSYLKKTGFPEENFFTYSSTQRTSNFFLHANEIVANGRGAGQLKLEIPGAHNRQNALGAFAVCQKLGVPPEKILKSLAEYTGASRRFEIKGHRGKTILIDDYAHHPAEIRATLQAAREKFPTGKICAVFQPHQYSRTRHLFDEFTRAFDDADTVIIPNIFAARDTAQDQKNMSGEQLAEAIKKNHQSVIYTGSLAATVELLREKADSFDAIITMGAGDVGEILDELKK